MLRLVALLVAAVSLGCAHPRLDDPPLSVVIVVTGLREDERVLLRDQACQMEGVSKCQLVQEAPPPAATGKKKKATPPPPSPQAKITFNYRGSLGELRYQIAALPHPGLEALSADVQLGYRGFDNLAPSITIDGPKDGIVVADKLIGVNATVPDPDVAEVDIGGREALPQSGGRYVGEAELNEGDNAIVVHAVDTAGNARDAVVHVFVDTTPPELDVQVEILAYDRALVTGKVKDAVKVVVDGKEVEVDLFGSFKREVAVDPDKTMIDVIATDGLGNARKIRRSAKIASPMGDQTK